MAYKLKSRRQRQLLIITEEPLPKIPRIKSTTTISKISHADTWEKRIHQLRQYHSEHGHVNVPFSNKLLGHWVSTQRKQYNALLLKKQSSKSNAVKSVNRKGTAIGVLTSSRIKQLNELGFVWNAYEETWKASYKELIQYKEKHGHVLVPFLYPLNTKLGHWVNEQRKMYKMMLQRNSNVMTQERIQALNKIGFAWSLRNRRSKSQQQNSRSINNIHTSSNTTNITNRTKNKGCNFGQHQIEQQCSSEGEVKKRNTSCQQLQFISNNKKHKKDDDEFANSLLVNGGAVTDLCPLTASVALESIVPTAAIFVVQPALTPNNGCDNGINYDSSEDKQGIEEEIKIKQSKNDDDTMSALPPLTTTAATIEHRMEKMTNRQENNNCNSIHNSTETLPGMTNATTEEASVSFTEAGSFVIATATDSSALINGIQITKDLPSRKILDHAEVSGIAQNKEEERAASTSIETKDNEHINYTVKEETATGNKPGTATTAVDSIETHTGRKRTLRNREWFTKLMQLAEYKRIHGHTNVPHRSSSLGSWVSSQRSKYKLSQKGLYNTLTIEREQHLEALQFNWNGMKKGDTGKGIGKGIMGLLQRNQHKKESFYTRDDLWEEQYQKLIRYKQNYGNCNCPFQYHGDSKPSLGYWVSDQRKHYKSKMLGKANPLTKERYTKLQSIGFVWTIRRHFSGKGKQITNTKKPMCNNNNTCLQKLELTGELKFICSQKDDHHDDDHHNDNITANHQHNDSVNIYELHNQLHCHKNSSTSINDDKSPCIRASKKDFAAANKFNHHHFYNDVDSGVKNNIPFDNDDTTSGATPLTTHDYDTKINNKNKSKKFTVEATSTTKFNFQSNCNSRAEDVVDNLYQHHHDLSHHQESTSDSSGFDPIFWANE